MNTAHYESLELLKIVHGICVDNNIKYTIAADSLIEYKNKMEFGDCIPIIYIALMYKDCELLCNLLQQYCENHIGYSFHDYKNTEQFDTFERWFIKESKINFSKTKIKDSFYYGTRLIITPLFYVGNTENEWNRAYKFFKDTIYTINARHVLKGKPLKSFVKLTPKRRLQNHYIKLRGKYSVQQAVSNFGESNYTQYVIYPHVVDRNEKDINSVVSIVGENSKDVLSQDWNDVEIVIFSGVECYCIKNIDKVIACFPDYKINETLSKNKSQLALNGNTYLWRVQQIQIELLKEFDRICRKYNIKYNISFGTLLGAIRHGGFIPWDDDIDVTLMSDDFERLDEIMKKELDSEKYYFRCPNNEENNHLIFKHLERKGTVYTKPGRNKLNRQIGVFIDIFPMYPSAHFCISDWFHAKMCRYWRTALWATVGADSEKDDKLRQKYKKMARPGNKVCYDNFVKTANKYKNKKYLKFWIAMDRNPYKTPLVKVVNYTDAIEVEFEGYKFMAPGNYEQVLDYCFGHDWKMYPSVRGRMPAHSAIMEIGDLYKKESEGLL